MSTGNDFSRVVLHGGTPGAPGRSRRWSEGREAAGGTGAADPADAFLEHWTADTGNVSPALRPEANAAALAALAPMVAAGTGYVPGFDGWTWTAWRNAGALCWHVYAPDGSKVFRCAASPGGDRSAWQTTANAARLAGGVDPASSPPAGPWLLVALQDGAAIHPEAAAWLPLFCECLAWTWIER